MVTFAQIGKNLYCWDRFLFTELTQYPNSFIFLLEAGQIRNALKNTGYTSPEVVAFGSGENEYLIRSTRRPVENRINRLSSEERVFIQQKIDVITGEKTEYRI